MIATGILLLALGVLIVKAYGCSDFEAYLERYNDADYLGAQVFCLGGIVTFGGLLVEAWEALS